MVMKPIGTFGTLLMLTAMLFVSRCHHPVPSGAAVEIVPGAVTPADGIVLKELASAFDRAEMAVQHADLDASCCSTRQITIITA